MLTFQSLTVNKMDELVFENRNKDYGAYMIRRSYNNTLLKSLATTLLIIGVFLGSVLTVSKLFPDEVLLDLKTKLYPTTTVIRVLPSNIKEPAKEQIKKQTQPNRKKESNDKIQKNAAPIVTGAESQKKDEQNTTDKPLASAKDSTDWNNDALARNGSTDDGEDLEDKDHSASKSIERSQADSDPEFPGGEKALVNYLSRNMRYPQQALENGTTGTVHLQFIVDTDGSVTNVEILRNIKDGCSQEAVRVVKQMPKWKPGIYKKRPARVIYRLPVKFNM